MAENKNNLDEEKPRRSELATRQIEIAKAKIRNQMLIGERKEQARLRKRDCRNDDNPAFGKKSKKNQEKLKKDEGPVVSNKPKMTQDKLELDKLTDHQEKYERVRGKLMLLNE